MNRSSVATATLACVAAAFAIPAAAVPIPWKNCGTAGDPLIITKADASVWPPQVAAPAVATATFDGSGQLVNLRLFLVHGIAWTFDSGALPSSTSGGFVTIPASFPMSVASPAFPIAAGPVNTTITFGSGGPTPVTVMDQANVAHDIGAVTTTVSLSTDGSPGFPLAPSAGSAYALHVDMAEQGGARVFCMDIVIPMKSDAPVVSIFRIPALATVSRAGIPILAGLMLAATLLVVRRRRAPARP
jgi:hypothetical protein